MAQGDEDAVVGFVRRHERRVVGVAWATLRDGALADEVAEEAFVRAWRQAAAFDPRRAAGSTWLLAIARQLALDRVRLRGRVPLAAADVARLDDMAPEGSECAFDRRARVRQALGQLPPAQRRALLLAAAWGHDAFEIAAAEGISVAAAGARLGEGLAALRRVLVGVEEEPETDNGEVCPHVRAHLAALALGILEGRSRGAVLAHLERCVGCGLEADRLASTADLLIELAPPRSPHRRLERAVLADGRARRRPRAIRGRVLVAGVLALLLVVGALVGVLDVPGAAKAPSRSTVPVVQAVHRDAHRATVSVAGVLRRPDGTVVGTVRLRGGQPARLFVHLIARDAPPARWAVRTRAGSLVDLGPVPAASWRWAAPLPVAASAIRAAELLGPDGAPLARAALSP